MALVEWSSGVQTTRHGRAGRLYNKTGLGQSWRPLFFLLEGTVLYYYKREGDLVPNGIVVLTRCPIRATKEKNLYIFRISHPKTSKIYELAATMPCLLQQRLDAALGLLPLHARGRVGHESPDVPSAVIPDEYRGRIDGLLVGFVAQVREDADGWKFQTEQRDVKAYVRCTPWIGAFKGEGFIAHHPPRCCS
ncbi:hypothetical protein PR002_g11155 [Phytophthora rubi]|uniref:PH domain-containing protein n=1 Tax=Phytophthora rubi TaxID=129364 RepID=A0A6A3M7A1_9STRA|nr:hypothetical protein PR002_g11155 [Phytophthora rubi]